jgi:hypothetical protein
MGYRTRWLNYQRFRSRLSIPLLTVELAYGAELELRAGDATRLIQLHSDQVMWQKERLLNLAHRALPGECRKVVWLDCDLVFERDDWPVLVSRALDDHVLVQPYATVIDLARDADFRQPLEEQNVWVRPSMAAQFAAGLVRANGIQISMLNEYSPGHAWAMRRDVLEETGFYDAFIVGGGDHLMAQAALGAHEHLARIYRLTEAHARHYLAWATRFHRRVDGMGVIPGRLFHLWHGDLADRRYAERLGILADAGFDPEQDIATDESGCWRWSSDKPRLHSGVRAYFAARREDGGSAPSAR